jgi:hypothetical protein
MVNCCSRRDDQIMPLINETPIQKASWKGHFVSFNCGGSSATGPCSIVALAVASVASVMLTQILIHSEFQNSPLGFVSMMGLITVILTSTCMEGTTHWCKRSRICISPAILMTAALVASCSTLLGMRGYANHEISSYAHNKMWVNATNQEIKENCDSIVSVQQQNWTKDDCALCDETTGTLDTFMNGPYQSYLSTTVYIEVLENIDNCNLPHEGKITISANRSEKGRDYLCGLPYTLSSPSTSSTMLIEECLIRYISEHFCMAPPLYLKGFASSRGLSLGGFASTHISVYDRCLPENSSDVCFPFRKDCDTSAATAFFDQIQKEYELVKNKTLPYPTEAYQVLSLTRAFVVPAALTTGALSALAALYEIFAFRKYLQSRLARYPS